MINDLINKVRKTTYAISMENKYSKNAQINGFILQKPKIVETDKVLSVSLIVYQFDHDAEGYPYMRTYNIISYVSAVIEQLRDLEYVTFVNCDCLLKWNTRLKTLFPSAYKLDVVMSIDLKLDPPYEKERK